MAEPPPLEFDLALSLPLAPGFPEPEMPFRLIESLAASALIKSPPPVLPTDCSFSSCFFFLFSNLRSLAFLNFALPAPPAFRMASSKLARPVSGAAASGGTPDGGAAGPSPGGGGAGASIGGGGGGGGGALTGGGGGGGGAPPGGGGGGGAFMGGPGGGGPSPTRGAGPEGIDSISGITDGRSGILLPGTDGAMALPESALYDISSATPEKEYVMLSKYKDINVYYHSLNIRHLISPTRMTVKLFIIPPRSGKKSGTAISGTSPKPGM